MARETDKQTNSDVGSGSCEAGGAPMSEIRATYPPVITASELASILRLDRRTVYEELRQGRIPGARPVGRQYRIDRDVVLLWLSDGHGRVSRSSPRS